MKFRYRVGALLFFLALITYLDRICISVAGPRIQEYLRIGPEQWGWIVGIFAIAYGVSEIPGGWMADRFGPRITLTRILLTVVVGVYGAHWGGLYVSSSLGDKILPLGPVKQVHFRTPRPASLHEIQSGRACRPPPTVVAFPGPGGKFQISQDGGWNDMWDKKGHLYFLSMGNRLTEVDLGFSGGAVQVKAIHPLFQLSVPSFASPFYDVSADGSRFLVVTRADPNASPFHLLDWESKLKGNCKMTFFIQERSFL